MVYLLASLIFFVLIGVLPPVFWEKTKMFFSFVNDICAGIKNIIEMFSFVIRAVYEFLVSPFRNLGNFIVALLQTSRIKDAQHHEEQEKIKEDDVNLRKDVGEIWIAVKTGTTEEKEAAKQRLVMLMEKHGEAKINLFLKEAQSV